MKYNYKYSVLLFTVFLTLAFIVNFKFDSCASEGTVLTDKKEREINELILECQKKGKIPGVFVTIVEDDSTIFQAGFGYSDMDKKIQVTSKTLFEIGSNSKAFTALGILLLQEEGIIELDSPVSDYIPWLTFYYKDEIAAVTIEQLMHHTTGIPFRTIDLIPESKDMDALEQTIRSIDQLELKYKPGTVYEYATINYDVLGLVIEYVTGISYENYIDEFILSPMKLEHTYMNKLNQTELSKGYMLGFQFPYNYEAPVYRGNTPAGYIISCGDDMAKWLKIQLGTSSDSVFHTALIEQSHQANKKLPSLKNGSSYAGGWFSFQNGGGEYIHGGNNPNFSSSLAFYTEEQIGIAVLGNINSSYVTEIREGIREILSTDEYALSKVMDLNKTADLIAILILGISIIIGSITVYLIIRRCIQLTKKQCKISLNTNKKINKVLAALLFAAVIIYSIYLIPYIFYDGVSWKFVFVWLPITVKLAYYLLNICICLVFFYFILLYLIKDDYNKSV